MSPMRGRHRYARTQLPLSLIRRARFGALPCGLERPARVIPTVAKLLPKLIMAFPRSLDPSRSLRSGPTLPIPPLGLDIGVAPGPTPPSAHFWAKLRQILTRGYYRQQSIRITPRVAAIWAINPQILNLPASQEPIFPRNSQLRFLGESRFLGSTGQVTEQIFG